MIFPRLRSLTVLLGKLCLTAPALLLLYLASWCVMYRLPTTPWHTVDLRSSKEQRPYYVLFCASLASNPLGFPGHCYVVWSTIPSPNLEQADALSFMPTNYPDQLYSLWREVPGMMLQHSARGNMRNLDMLIAVMSQQQYRQSLETRTKWQLAPFKVGERDCADFAQTIASSIGLHTVRPGYTYPQDYIRRLKEMN